jgi:hypothetical protein
MFTLTAVTRKRRGRDFVATVHSFDDDQAAFAPLPSHV